MFSGCYDKRSKIIEWKLLLIAVSLVYFVTMKLSFFLCGQTKRDKIGLCSLPKERAVIKFTYLQIPYCEFYQTWFYTNRAGHMILCI